MHNILLIVICLMRLTRIIDTPGVVTGPLPQSWTNLSMSFFSFYDNAISGTLVAGYADAWPQITHLDLSYNTLTGVLNNWKGFAAFCCLAPSMSLTSPCMLFTIDTT